MKHLLLCALVGLMAAPLGAQEPQATLKGHEGDVNCVVFSPDGKMLASGGDDKTIKMWDVGTGKNVVTLNGHAGGVYSVAFSPDGKLLASASEDKSVKVWDVAAGKNTLTLNGHVADTTFAGPYNRGICHVAFSPDGKTLAWASEDNTIKLWDLASGKETATFKGHKSALTSIAFAPDGKTLGSGGFENEVKLWHVATGESTKLAIPAEGRRDPGIAIVRFSSDGKTLASSGMCIRTITLWDVASGESTGVLDEYTRWGVAAMVFTPDRKGLIAEGFTEGIKVWDVSTGKCTSEEDFGLDRYPIPVSAAAFSSDGKTLAIAPLGDEKNTGGIIQLWDVSKIKLRDVQRP